jgi:GntR family transcriptional regulator of vanillate catabolism
MAQSTMPEARTILTVAQDQHRCVVEAIENREGGRAEMIMREHARLASRNLRLVLRSRSGLDLIPGASLITVTGRG